MTDRFVREADRFVLAAQEHDPSTELWHSGGGIMLVRRVIDAETDITADTDESGLWWFVIDRGGEGWDIWPRGDVEAPAAFDAAVRAYRDDPANPASTSAGQGMRWERW